MTFEVTRPKSLVQNMVWDINTLTWVVMRQPILEAGSVTIGGTMTIQDGGNIISVDDAGSSITVDGPITDAELRASAVPVSLATAPTTAVTNAGLTALNGAIAGTEVQVDVLTMPTTTIQDGGGSITVDGTFFQATQPVSIAATVAVKEVRSSTGTTTSVNDTAVSTTLLSSNANRLGASIYNDSTAILYVKMGTTASATDFGIKLQPDGYAEIPFGYTGRIDGIWASDASGAARIVEYT